MQTNDIQSVIRALGVLVGQGDLTERFELVCPNPECARTAATFEREEDVPVGSEFECEKCGESFLVTASDVVVSYVPTQPFISRVLREARAEPLSGEPFLGAYEKKATRSMFASPRW